MPRIMHSEELVVAKRISWDDQDEHTSICVYVMFINAKKDVWACVLKGILQGRPPAVVDVPQRTFTSSLSEYSGSNTNMHQPGKVIFRFL